MPTVVQLLSALVSYRDAYQRLESNRDFEIKHVWQRAIFLTAFLIACFAGYGGLVVSIITPGKSVISPITANGVAFAIAFVGMVISLLWIMMAKGSKMWYENYENAIEAFRKSYASNAFDAGVDKISGMKLSDITGYIPPDISDWIWSTKGGRYSVSRINIFIGQISFLIWAAILIIHILIAKTCVNGIVTLPIKSFLTDWKAMSVSVIVALIMFWGFSHFCLKSRD